MRYAALNQDADVLARYGDFVPREAVPFLLGKAPANPAKLDSGRYSDEQLYALGLYIYSLKPPPSPHAVDAPAARAEGLRARRVRGLPHAAAVYQQHADPCSGIHAAS